MLHSDHRKIRFKSDYFPNLILGTDCPLDVYSVFVFVHYSHGAGVTVWCTQLDDEYICLSQWRKLKNKQIKKNNV